MIGELMEAARVERQRTNHAMRQDRRAGEVPGDIVQFTPTERLKILAVIPARRESKRLKDKNLLALLGRPMLAWTLDAIQESRLITRTVVSTEDEDVKNIALNLGLKVIDRPAELAADDINPGCACQHAVTVLENAGWSPDIVVEVPPCCPVRPSGCLDTVLSAMIERNALAACCVAPVTHCHPSWTVRLNQGRLRLAFPGYRPLDNRNEYESFHYITGTMFAIRRDVLMSKDNPGSCALYDGESLAVEYPASEQIDIDRQEDFEMAEMILERRQSKTGNLRKRRNAHRGKTCCVVGMGPTLLNLTKESFGPEDVVLALNDAIVHIEKLGLTNSVYSMQKDGFCVRPQRDALIVHELEGVHELGAEGANSPDYEPRYVFHNPNDFDLEWYRPSVVTALKIAELFGCPKVKLLACDALSTGDCRRVEFDSAGVPRIEIEFPCYTAPHRETPRTGAVDPYRDRLEQTGRRERKPVEGRPWARSQINRVSS